MISATLHTTDAVILHPISYVSSWDWFTLHIVQGWAIRYLNEINCYLFGEVENHFVPVACEAL